MPNNIHALLHGQLLYTVIREYRGCTCIDQYPASQYLHGALTVLIKTMKAFTVQLIENRLLNKQIQQTLDYPELKITAQLEYFKQRCVFYQSILTQLYVNVSLHPKQYILKKSHAMMKTVFYRIILVHLTSNIKTQSSVAQEVVMPHREYIDRRI